MNRPFARAALVTLYAAALLATHVVLTPTGDFVVPGVLAALFAGATLNFVGRAYAFIVVSVAVLTCLLPIAFLITVVRKVEVSYAAALHSLLANLFAPPVYGLDVLWPSIVACVIAAGAWTWRRPSTVSGPSSRMGG